MLALDELVLWVHAGSPIHTAGEQLVTLKANQGKMRMGGTGSKQEDQIITVAIERSAGSKLT